LSGTCFRRASSSLARSAAPSPGSQARKAPTTA